MRTRLAGAVALASIVGLLVPSSSTAEVVGTDVTYTSDADFDAGTLVSVNHDAPFNDQLQLDSPTEPFPFINVAASGRGTVVRVNTDTGEIVGEYRTAPEDRGLNPSRTTVDLFGNVWTANREEVGDIDGVPHGSAVKIGLIVGGTRVDASGVPDATGGYLAPPFGYSTCVDRDGDGLVRTSSGLLDVLDWPDVTDGSGGTDGVVEDAVDECVLVYQRLPDAEQARHVSVDADNNVWVGGFPFEQRQFHKLDGATGAILDSFDSREFGCGGYGGLIDGNGVLWSIGWGSGEGPLLRYDPATRTGSCVNTFGGYGLGIDTNGYVWASLWESGIAKVSPDGVLEPGFPKSTWLPPSTLAPAASFASTETTSFTPPPVGDLAPLSMPEPTVMPTSFLALAAPDEAPDFSVAPDDDWVGSMSPWTPGTTVHMDVDDGTDVVFSDSQIVDPDGNFGFNLWMLFDVQRGHTVTVSDGVTTKTHAVLDLFVDGIDVGADTVAGRADAGTDVDVWVNDTETNVTVTANESGNWVAGFSGTVDLTYASNGGSQQTDDDGDTTGVSWAGPAFVVSPDDDWVGSITRWTAGSTVALTIVGSAGSYADTQVVDPDGNFNFNFGGAFDLQRGDTVTVTDGTTTKIHVVLGLDVEAIDLDFDTVSGRATPGTDVDVWVHQDDSNLTVTPDSSGNWTADFSALTDLTAASDGNSQQLDDDGDATWDFWSLPRFVVSPDDDWVGSLSRWPIGTTVTLTIVGSSGSYADTQVVDPGGNFNFNLWEIFDVQRGDTVTVTDSTTTKTHVVLDLDVEAIDLDLDTVSGRAMPGADVDVWVDQDGSGVTITPDGSGNWTADFSGLTDLTYESNGNSQQLDDDGDGTWDSWASPSFTAAPDDDWVGSFTRWTAGTTVALTIVGNSGSYAETQVVDPDGNFNFNLGGVFDLQRGDTVTVTDGTTTKTHDVFGLFVDGIDVTADTVSGRAAPGIDVDVWVHDTDANVTVTADGSGNWTADFSDLTDLTHASNGGSQQIDVDGDTTGVWWASPSFTVSPDDDWVQSATRWTSGSTVTLAIAGGAGSYIDSQLVDPDGNFNFNLGGVFDLQRGDTVTVSDGTTTKTHVVLDLDVDAIDLTADTVSGRATPGTDVDVWVHDTDANVTVTADGSGNWTADFSSLTDLTHASNGGSQQADDDGDSTFASWQLPRFVVDIDNEQLSGDGWSRGTTLEVYLDAALVDTVVTNSGGRFDAGAGFDFAVGDLVTVVGPAHTKALLLTNPVVSDLDVAADLVSGTAEPLAELDVWAATNLWSEGNMRVVTADATGAWTADFSVPFNEWPPLDVTETTSVTIYEWDDDRDATIRHAGPPVQANRGVAVTSVDNHVWVANSEGDTVTRLDNDGNVLAMIEVGGHPTGVAVDAAGKVWVTNLGSDSTMRIDPAGGPDGLGAVDLTVELGEGASPYNYSDMTGAVVVGSTSPQGFWTVVQDSGEAGFEWGRITWNTEPEAREPVGSEIVVEVRTADSEAGLGGQAFVPVGDGELFSSFGRFIEVRVTLKASPDNLSPVLSDIRVQPALIEVDVDIKPGSYPNSINLKRTTGVIPVAVLGGDDFDVSTIDVSTLRFGPNRALPAHDLTNLGKHLKDVDGDGYLDLISHYPIGETGLGAGDTEACLTGETVEGVPIEGCDSVRTFWP